MTKTAFGLWIWNLDKLLPPQLGQKCNNFCGYPPLPSVRSLPSLLCIWMSEDIRH